MKQETEKYQFSQLGIYKESLELAHLKRKTKIFNSFVFILAGIVLYFLLQLGSGFDTIITTMIMFVILLTINFAFYSYEEDLYNNLKISMYISTLVVYVIAVSLILQ